MFRLSHGDGVPGRTSSAGTRISSGRPSARHMFRRLFQQPKSWASSAAPILPAGPLIHRLQAALPRRALTTAPRWQRWCCYPQSLTARTSASSGPRGV